MIEILLFVHIVIAVLLIAVILLQQTGTDGLSGLGGGGAGNMGLITARSAANFLTRVTIVLTVLFFVNAIVLANLSSRKSVDITDTINEVSTQQGEAVVPMAK